ncbi:hypothetical protein [Actinomyces oris]|uniref:hypothetical protein n=1 Tax=Actinomyces oris TaxID=544580 RepID=UPI000B135DDF|nr:hypothetical protein [Actinomyces oris]
MSPLFRTVSTGQVIMRRRVFLTAALGATAGAGALSLSGCADVRQRIARTLTPQPPHRPSRVTVHAPEGPFHPDRLRR